MSKKTIVALNIGSTGVKLLSMRGKEIEKWGSLPLPPGLVKDGLILKPKVVGTVINSLFKSTGITRKNVIVSLTGLSFVHRVLTLPKMENDVLHEALQRAAGKEMLLSLEDLYLSGQVIEKKAAEISFLVFGVPRNPIDVLLQALREAGIEPSTIDLNPLALARVARRQNAIIVNLEPDCLDIVLIADGLPNIMRTITPVEAGATAAEISRRLADELTKIVEFYNNNHPQNTIGPNINVLMTGELSTKITAGELNIEDAGYIVEPLTTPMRLPEDLPAAAFTTNVGLALRGSTPKSRGSSKAIAFRDIAVDIQSGQFGIKKRWFKLHHILLSLAIIAAIVLLYPVNQSINHADAEAVRLQADLTALNQELSEAQTIAEQARQTEDKINKLTSDAESIISNLQSIKKLGGNYAYYLKLVNDALPAGTQFTSMNIGKTAIAVSGTVDNPFNVINYALALETLGTFKDVRIVSIGAANESTGGPITFAINIEKKS
jgi:Tfp pilus assembly protein PilN